MTVSRLPLIVPLLLLLAAAAPETAPTVTTPSVPPAATTPSAPPVATVPKPPPAATGPKLPPTVSLQKVAPDAAMPILGHTVVGPGGKVIARLVDVLVDSTGQPVAAVVDFGGFMGVGTRKIAVHWDALHFEPAATSHRVILLLTPNEIKAAPEYKGPSNAAPVVVPAATATKSGPQ
jgi:hypothetical protein